MSKIALTPNASGSGTFTIAAPNSNTDRTLTLPDEAGTVLTTGATAFATGMMKQVGHALNQTYSNMNLTGGGFNDVTGLSVTVTPNSASSKFFLYARVHGELSQNEHQVSLRFLRDSTPVNVGTATQSGQNEVMYTSGDALNGNASTTPITGTMFTLDSPNTTSAITYKVQLSDQGNNLNFYLNGTVNDTTGIGVERGSSELIVLEVF